MGFEKLVVVTRKTRLEELVHRFNSRAQAKFYIEHAGGDFGEYVAEHDAYRGALDGLRRDLELGLKVQEIERHLVPTYLFADKDLVVTVGQDGLVANTAKYCGAQPIVALNPDPERFDGILLPFSPCDAAAAVRRVLAGRAKVRRVTLAEVELAAGQRLLGFNDLYLGARTHVSARYRIRAEGRAEAQSSSGLLISTGAGSTGWLSSVFNMAAGVTALRSRGLDRRAAPAPEPRADVSSARLRLSWEDGRLVYVVREPFASRHSSAGIVAGVLAEGERLVVESLMPSGGVIFSDGVEDDYLSWSSGAVATIRAADRRAQLVVP